MSVGAVGRLGGGDTGLDRATDRNVRIRICEGVRRIPTLQRGDAGHVIWVCATLGVVRQDISSAMGEHSNQLGLVARLIFDLEIATWLASGGDLFVSSAPMCMSRGSRWSAGRRVGVERSPFLLGR